jgi:hyaluronoglucosaminidase
MELGLIEGYYGAPWSWEARAETIAFLAPHGYGFYLYAPKTDAFLRERWHENHPPETLEKLRTLAARCRTLGVHFGVGLSPFEIYRDFNAEAREALERKLAAFDGLGVEWLAILFDDMKGDLPDLAETQASIMDWIAARTKARRLIFCPTYYSDDPVLDCIFGARPAAYLQTLGRRLDPAVEIFWTGPEVCARAIEPAHAARVADELGRKPFLWDNYPVNDGARMSQYLHLRGFTGRDAGLSASIAAHAVNPALQPVLSRIPALTLADVYRLGDAYEHGRAFERAANEVAGAGLGMRIREDLIFLQDVGLDRLGKEADRLRARYAEFDHPAAREIVAWLDGVYRFKKNLEGS